LLKSGQSYKKAMGLHEEKAAHLLSSFYFYQQYLKPHLETC
jgi:hypothetical protein